MATFQQRLTIANSSRPDISSNLSSSLSALINANADAIGVPPEFILYPLLTAVASCMGVNAHVSINSSWREPSILWFIVAAKKGEKKTAALRVIKRAMEAIEKTMKAKWEQDSSETKNKCPPQLLVDSFSFEELHCLMTANKYQMLGMFDEMSS